MNGTRVLVPEEVSYGIRKQGFSKCVPQTHHSYFRILLARIPVLSGTSTDTREEYRTSTASSAVALSAQEPTWETPTFLSGRCGRVTWLQAKAILGDRDSRRPQGIQNTGSFRISSPPHTTGLSFTLNINLVDWSSAFSAGIRYPPIFEVAGQGINLS